MLEGFSTTQSHSAKPVDASHTGQWCRDKLLFLPSLTVFCCTNSQSHLFSSFQMYSSFCLMFALLLFVFSVSIICLSHCLQPVLLDVSADSRVRRNIQSRSQKDNQAISPPFANHTNIHTGKYTLTPPLTVNLNP